MSINSKIKSRWTPSNETCSETFKWHLKMDATFKLCQVKTDITQASFQVGLQTAARQFSGRRQPTSPFTHLNWLTQHHFGMHTSLRSSTKLNVSSTSTDNVLRCDIRISKSQRPPPNNIWGLFPRQSLQQERKHAEAPNRTVRSEQVCNNITVHTAKRLQPFVSNYMQIKLIIIWQLFQQLSTGLARTASCHVCANCTLPACFCTRMCKQHKVARYNNNNNNNPPELNFRWTSVKYLAYHWQSKLEIQTNRIVKYANKQDSFQTITRE